VPKRDVAVVRDDARVRVAAVDGRHLLPPAGEIAPADGRQALTDLCRASVERDPGLERRARALVVRADVERAAVVAALDDPRGLLRAAEGVRLLGVGDEVVDSRTARLREPGDPAAAVEVDGDADAPVVEDARCRARGRSSGERRDNDD
jgi:hypothetical protein